MANILIIDDEELVRRTVKHVLELGDHVVVEASDGVTGMQRFAEGAFDIVITDILMPEKEGIETIRELRTMAPDIAIVAVSGAWRTAQVDFLEIAEKLGADYTLPKPFTPQQLVSVVHACLRR